MMVLVDSTGEREGCCSVASAASAIAVTTGIITKVSASSVHWGRCEESTTDLVDQISTPTIPFDTLVTGMV